jgi:hypothetical protein
MDEDEGDVTVRDGIIHALAALLEIYRLPQVQEAALPEELRVRLAATHYYLLRALVSLDGSQPEDVDNEINEIIDLMEEDTCQNIPTK